MNFAERLAAGPPVLATVGRRAAQGDVVVLSLDAQERDGQDYGAFEVAETRPAIVGLRSVIARSLADPTYEGLYAFRDVIVLTKVEAKAAREHYADLKANA